MSKPESLYRKLVDQGDDTSAPARVRVERGADRATVTLDEPQRLNVLSASLVRQLRRALSALTDDPDIRVIVLTGADPGFSAGGDLQMMQTAIDHRDAVAGSTDTWRWIRREFGAIAKSITESDAIFVAAINGPAAGVGLAWALSCDIVIASERAILVPAFAKLGLIPEVGTSWALTRRLGYQGALAFYLRGDHIDARTALELGVVQQVVPHERLLDEADEWCARVIQLPPHTTAMTKTLLRAASDASWADALRLEEFSEPSCFTTAAFADSVSTMLGR